MRTRRLDFLDAIRGIAAATVAIGHYVEIAAPSYHTWAYHWVDFGRVGVTAFFLVSGYVIPMSLERSGGRGFVISRFFRLYPAFWVAAGLTLLAAWLHVGQPVTLSPTQILVNLGLLQLFAMMPNLVGVTWTLGIELVFYAQGWVLARFGRLRSGPSMGYAWLGLFLLMGVVAPALGHKDLPITGPMLLFTACLGHALYRWEHRLLAGAALARLAVTGLVCVLVVAVVNFGVYAPPPVLTVLGPVQWTPVGYSASYLVGVAAFAVAWLLRHRRFPTSAVYLGAISYSIYLLHPIVYGVVLTYLPARSPLGMVLFVALTVLAATAVYRLVELPSIAYGKRVSAPKVAPDAADLLPFLDDDGQVRPARVLAERDGRVCVRVTRRLGRTHVLWRPAERLQTATVAEPV